MVERVVEQQAVMGARHSTGETSLRTFLHCLLLAGVLLWSGSAMAATYYVAQQAPNSADSNTGTEAVPWKTLTHACAAAKTGDVVWVKAGVYTETLSPQCDGLTVQAYGDDQVVITPPRTLLANPEAWTKVPDTRSVYQYVSASDRKVVIAPATTPNPGEITPTSTAFDELGGVKDIEGQMLRVDGMALQFLQTYGDDIYIDAGDGQTIIRPLSVWPLDTMERHWARTADGHIQVNLGGENPATHRVEVSPSEFVGIHLTTDGCLVRGIEVRGAQTGIRFDGSRNVVQFCVVRDAYYGSFSTNPGSTMNTLFACAFLNNNMGIDVEDVPGSNLFDSNLIVGTGYQPLTNRTAQRDFSQPWGMGTSLRYGNTHQNIFRYNTVTEGTFAGWWPDVNCYSNFIYGNIFTRIRDRALYNEYPVNDSVILYNAITKCDTGICSRFSWRMRVMHNYVAENDVAVSLWGPHVDNPYVFDNLFARNLFADSEVYLDFSDDRGVASGLPIRFESDGETSATGRFRSFSNIFIDNTYKGPARESFGVLNEDIEFATLERFQEATGQEPNGRVDANARMEDQGLGIYTVRIPESARPDQAVAVVGNPMRHTVHVDPIPVAAEDAPFFWSQGDHATMMGGQGWQYNMEAHYEWP
ncbi:MAG: DUF1565 domain-containing protein, partial [Thermoleophilia bacterium]|nr:DUF1565 domain-containing protein [Thermoleophilia bacterium]